MKNHGKNRNNGRNENHPFPASHSSHSVERIIPPRGDYQTLHSFHKAEVVYDITFRFVHKHLAKSDRTIDQMIQAARSGKKNLLEGSKAGLTSKETEIKLTNVARSSLEELLDDYGDYLRVREYPEWDKNSREGSSVRPPTWPQGSADVRTLPRICGNPTTEGHREHCNLPDPSS
jgi:hypothetical protein